ncbi:MAG: hypothetical protein CM15mP102_19780 [Flavobacteriales bacterium]|nr:MAG: hypothetical protein CM15mP102_19780 [Flavobacteriales bacterium]
MELFINLKVLRTLLAPKKKAGEEGIWENRFQRLSQSNNH